MKIVASEFIRLDYIENVIGINKFISDFEDFISIIETQPKAFPKTKKINNIRRIVINKLTSVTYTIKKDTIIIITVYDNRTNN